MTLNCHKKYFIVSGGTIWDDTNLYDLYIQAYTPWEWHQAIFDEAKKCGINGTTYHKDGSLFYGIDYRTKSQVEVDKFATTWEHGSYSENNNFSPTYAKRFESLLKLLNDNGVKVLFVFSPYHPIFWKRIRGLKPMVEGMEYIDSIAKKYEISTIGAYDPILINADNTYFYDGAHLRQEMMDRLVVSGNSLGK